MRRKLLILLTMAAVFWVGFMTGRGSHPPKVVTISEYRYFPMPTDCEKCDHL